MIEKEDHKYILAGFEKTEFNIITAQAVNLALESMGEIDMNNEGTRAKVRDRAKQFFDILLEMRSDISLREKFREYLKT